MAVTGSGWEVPAPKSTVEELQEGSSVRVLKADSDYYGRIGTLVQSTRKGWNLIRFPATEICSAGSKSFRSFELELDDGSQGGDWDVPAKVNKTPATPNPVVQSADIPLGSTVRVKKKGHDMHGMYGLVTTAHNSRGWISIEFRCGPKEVIRSFRAHDLIPVAKTDMRNDPKFQNPMDHANPIDHATSHVRNLDGDDSLVSGNGDIGEEEDENGDASDDDDDDNVEGRLLIVRLVSAAAEDEGIFEVPISKIRPGWTFKTGRWIGKWAPDSFSNVLVNLDDFPIGTTVEIMQRAIGFSGSWFQGVVLGHEAPNNILIRYEEDRMNEDAHEGGHSYEATESAKYVRPLKETWAPGSSEHQAWLMTLKPGDPADLYFDGGWWDVIVESIPSSQEDGESKAYGVRSVQYDADHVVGENKIRPPHLWDPITKEWTLRTTQSSDPSSISKRRKIHTNNGNNGVGTPQLTSTGLIRKLLAGAIHQGLKQRDEIVEAVVQWAQYLEVSDELKSRKYIVTTLGREHKRSDQRWVQIPDSAEYAPVRTHPSLQEIVSLYGLEAKCTESKIDCGDSIQT